MHVYSSWSDLASCGCILTGLRKQARPFRSLDESRNLCISRTGLHPSLAHSWRIVAQCPDTILLRVLIGSSAMLHADFITARPLSRRTQCRVPLAPVYRQLESIEKDVLFSVLFETTVFWVSAESCSSTNSSMVMSMLYTCS